MEEKFVEKYFRRENFRRLLTGATKKCHTPKWAWQWCQLKTQDFKQSSLSMFCTLQRYSARIEWPNLENWHFLVLTDIHIQTDRHIETMTDRHNRSLYPFQYAQQLFNHTCEWFATLQPFSGPTSFVSRPNLSCVALSKNWVWTLTKKNWTYYLYQINLFDWNQAEKQTTGESCKKYSPLEYGTTWLAMWLVNCWVSKTKTCQIGLNVCWIMRDCCNGE